MELTAGNRIERHPQRCGGQPCVAGTRIRVWDVHIWHDVRGWSETEIVARFPQLTLTDVQAALAYFRDHCAEVEEQALAANEFEDQLRSHGLSAGFDSPELERLRFSVRRQRLCDEGKDEELRLLTPQEALAMMWPLAVQAWAWMGVSVAESRLPRHVVRVERHRG